MRSRNANVGQSIGFVLDPRRLNVAITRAKQNCIVIGNIFTLTGSGRNGTHIDINIWCDLLKYLINTNGLMQVDNSSGTISTLSNEQLIAISANSDKI